MIKYNKQLTRAIVNCLCSAGFNVSALIKFAHANINPIFDGIEFTSNNIIPIFITPIEKITKYDKQFIAQQAYYIQSEFNIHVESVKVIYGKLLNQTRFITFREEKYIILL